MDDHKACIEVLNDLVKINNDRIMGYPRATDQLKDEHRDLKLLFTNLISESQHFNRELSRLAINYGGEVSGSGTASGKLYRAWTDVKAVFTESDRRTILNNCEAGEDAAQKAYQMALDEEDVMPETKELIRRQQENLWQSHNKIKHLRDSYN